MSAVPETHLVQQVTVKNRHGLHARTAAMLVKTANRFQCELQLVRDGNAVNAKSIMGVLMLAAGQGSVLELIADGEDAAPAVAALVELFESGFHEE